MPCEVVMPKWGLSMKEGRITKWLKKEGEAVKKDEPLLEVETEKMVSVVESPGSGILARVLHPEGSTVAISETLALITEPNEAVPEVDIPTQGASERESSVPAPSLAPKPSPSPSGPIRAMPAARRLAKERGLNLAQINGTGPGGAITQKDVENALTAVVQPIQKASFFSDGHKLDGLLYTPSGLARGDRRPAILLCAGYTYLKSLVLPDIAKALNENGYVVLLFDYRGFGESEGPRWRLIPDEQVSDVRAALTFAADRTEVDAERIALLGVSLGGSNAIVAGALDRRAKAVVAIEPVGNGMRWLCSLRRHWEWLEFREKLSKDRSQRVGTGRSARVDPFEIVVPDPDSRKFLEGVLEEYPQMKCDLPLETAEALIEYRPEDYVARLSPHPLLLIHGANDLQVSTDESRQLYERAGEPRELSLLPNMGHFDWVMSGSVGFERVLKLTIDFLREHLPPE